MSNNYKSTLQSNNIELSSNNLDLQSLIDQANALPNGGGTDTNDATAIAADILLSKTAYVKGQKVTGTIPSQGAQTITPSTSDTTIAAGQYLSGIQTIKGDANLIPANIVSGKSIFGVVGSAEAGDGSGVEMIEVTHDSNSSSFYAYYFNSSYELTQVNRGSTVSALGGIIMYFGTYSLSARSGDYTVYDTGSYYTKIIKFNADGGSFWIITSGGGD